MGRIIAAGWLLALALGVSALTQGEPGLRTGDVVLQASRSEQSRFIQQATGSPWSHVGLVEVTPAGPVVIEAVGPVKATPWRTWRARGEGGRVLVLRPRDLSPEALRRWLPRRGASWGSPTTRASADWTAELYSTNLSYANVMQGAEDKLEITLRKVLDKKPAAVIMSLPRALK